ncbi:MAG: type II secretion system F family protein [Pseudomonadota bacterium]
MDTAVVGAVLAFVAIGGVGYAMSSGGPKQSAKAQKRMKQLAGAKPDKRKAQAEMQALKRRQTTQEALKELTQNEKQSRKRRVSIKGQIEQAGLKITVPQFWMMSAGLGVVLAIGGFIVHGLIAAAAGGFIGVLGLPRWILGMFVGARQKKFSVQLADAIDVIVRGVKSGLPLTQCLRIISAESPDPLRAEFQQLVDAQAMGVPLDQSMTRMYERMPLAEVNFFAIVLVIQQKTGGNLSESLGNLSSVLRARKLMKEKVNALSAEAKASAMIIGALPIIVMGMVYITKPAYIMILFNTPTGNLILLVCAVMMSLGIIIMRNMVNFKF